jgi:exonuclease VII large subunit
MTALWILKAYVALGVLAAVVVLVRGPGSPRARVGQALLTVGLWPFMLPVLLSPGEAAGCAVQDTRSERSRRLDEVATRLEDSWRQATLDSAWAGEPAREHQVLERFIARLRAQERRLKEMEAALAAAPASVKERLQRLYESAAAELEHSIGLVEDLSAQLTLLRFANLSNPAAARVERGHIEDLVARIEALAEASQPTGEAAAAPATVARA